MKLTISVLEDDEKEAITLGFEEHLKCYKEYLAAYHDYFEQCAAQRFPEAQALTAYAEFAIPKAIVDAPDNVCALISCPEERVLGEDENREALQAAYDVCRCAATNAIWDRPNGINGRSVLGITAIHFYACTLGSLCTFNLYTLTQAGSVKPPASSGVFLRRHVTT